MFDFFKKRRREKKRAEPFPDEWRAIVDKHVPYVRRLSETDRKELEGHMLVFLDEKSFEGCGGLELTEAMKVTIAAQACILLLHRETDYYPELASILVYPSAYRAPVTHGEGGIVHEGGEQARLGESSSRGTIVLAWDSVISGAANVQDGHNVVLHEFAHQLDQEDGSADGLPELPPESSRYQSWARVLGHDYEQLVAADERGQKTIIDGYGATNPAEFFAVVTETFFEKPLQLQRKHPELYEQMKGFYRQDPVAMVRPPKK